MKFKKYRAQAEVQSTSTSITPIDTLLFKCPENSTVTCLTLEVTAEADTIVYIKQLDKDETLMFQTKIDVEANDYIAFTHKLIFTEGQSLVIAADSDTAVVQAHCMIM